MKVIIADDEDKICQLIYKLVDWEQLDMQVQAIVHNGIEALEAIQKYHPDIVITDIRMPGYDGLEMIRRAKETCTDMDIIIISGYRHFEYAQNAIRYGVKDYLLKPIKKAELTDTLTRIRAEYMEKKERLSAEEQNRITVKNSVDKLRSAFFTEVLFRKEKRKEEITIEVINDEYHYKFKKGCYQVILIKIDGIDSSFKSNITYIQDKVLQSVNKRLAGECYEMECIFDGNMCYAVLNFSNESKRSIRKTLKSILDELLLQKDILENLRITLGAGIVEEDISGFIISLKTASWAIEQRLILGINKVIEGENTSLNEVADSKLFYDFNKQMTDSLEKLSEASLINALRYLQSALRNKENTTGHEIIQMSKEAMNLYLFTMRQNKFAVKEAESFFEKFSTDIENIGTAEEVFSYLIRAIVMSFRKAVAEKQQEDNKPIRDAKQYIREHFKEPVSLEIVSDLVGFNATYFSSLFKKETGKTFSEYLTEIRMEKAKELLKDTNLSVAAICTEVGYSDNKHFTKGFAKYTNLKPNEYRKIYS